MFALKFHFPLIILAMAWSFDAQCIIVFCCAHCVMCRGLLCDSWINFGHITYKSSNPCSIVIVAFYMLVNPNKNLLGFEFFWYTLWFVMELSIPSVFMKSSPSFWCVPQDGPNNTTLLSQCFVQNFLFSLILASQRGRW
jgi:hypothetical protein